MYEIGKIYKILNPKDEDKYITVIDTPVTGESGTVYNPAEQLGIVYSTSLTKAKNHKYSAWDTCFSLDVGYTGSQGNMELEEVKGNSSKDSTVNTNNIWTL